MGLEEILKKKIIAKLIEIKESLYLRNIWRTRNPNVKRLTFWQNQVPGFVERRLEIFLISNILQKSIIKTEVPASFCTDNSPIFFSLQLKDMPTWGKGFWKFSNSLTSNDDYVEKRKTKFLKLYECLTKTK